MHPNSRRAVIATALAGLAAGRAPVALASTSADAELFQRSAEFDARRDKYEAAGRAGRDRLVETMFGPLEEAADRVMAIQPKTVAGLAIWARMMLWRFDPTLTGIGAEPSEDLAEYGVNEAYALAAAIERMASHSAGIAS